jgi:hypothetical protein
MITEPTEILSNEHYEIKKFPRTTSGKLIGNPVYLCSEARRCGLCINKTCRVTIKIIKSDKGFNTVCFNIPCLIKN